MRCVPALKVNFFASWSFHFWYFFTPSIQTSRRWTPAGELPLAFTRTGEVRLAFAAGPQIFAAKFFELGGVQLVNALVLISASQPPFIHDEMARSCRESRFRSRATASARLLMPVIDDCVPKEKSPFPSV